MKTTVIYGQNHKGCTQRVAQTLLENIYCENEVAEFFLPKDLPHFCSGCLACLEERSLCPFWEEKKQNSRRPFKCKFDNSCHAKLLHGARRAY